VKILSAYRLATLLLVFSCPSVGLGESHSAEAKKHFEAGVSYVDDPSGAKWEEALKEFRAAYEISHNWRLMNNIAVCAMNLERDGEAIEAYTQYLAKAGPKELSAKQRSQAEKDLAMLSASLVKVKVDVEPLDAVLVDERQNSKGELLVNRYPAKDGVAAVGMHPGHHKVTIEADGYVATVLSFDAEPGSSVNRNVKLKTEAESKPEPTEKPREAQTIVPPPSPRIETKTPTAVYVGLAATGFFATAATVTGIIALNKDHQFNNSSDPAESDRLKSSGHTLAVLTDIELGATILSAGATAYFYFTAPKSTTGESAQRPKLQLAPVFSPTAAGVGVSGNF
jgi:hypothetical protein